MAKQLRQWLKRPMQFEGKKPDKALVHWLNDPDHSAKF